MKKSLYFAILIGTVVMTLCGCEQQPVATPSGKTIKVGIIAPFSGSDLAKGREGLYGIDTAIKMQPLLDSGDRIELITMDDQDDPEKAVKALKELVQTEKVSAIITFSSSGPVLALARVADTYTTPILAALATHPDVTKHNRYVSQLCFDNIFQGNVAALFVRDELLVDRVAVFSTPDSIYSQNLKDEFVRTFISLGGRITDELAMPGDITELAETLKRVRKNDPELLYLPVSANDLIPTIQELNKIDWQPRLMAGDGLLATVISRYKDQLDLMDGLLATDFYHHSLKLTSLLKRARKLHQGSKSTYAALGFEGVAILMDAINRCHDPKDRECINRQIRSTSNFEGLMGRISIDSNGKAQRPVLVNAIKNRKLECIVKVY